MHIIAQVHPSFPDLPLDIARLILETTAVLDRGTALRLALVSKLVRAWYAFASLPFFSRSFPDRLCVM